MDTSSSNWKRQTRLVTTEFAAEGGIILSEILSDENRHEWWIPKSKNHRIFDEGYMKFVNGNLNYFDLRNMVIVANDPEPYRNPAFPYTLKALTFIKNKIGQPGPFGRMSIWKMPPQTTIKPHRDSYPYHRLVNRWVLCLNLSEKETLIEFSGERQSSNEGTLIEFQPFHEEHTFANNSDSDWYFVTFDAWTTHLLERVTSPALDKAYSKDPRRRVYQSPH